MRLLTLGYFVASTTTKTMKRLTFFTLICLTLAWSQMSYAQLSYQETYDKAKDLAQRQNKEEEANALNEQVIDQARGELDDGLHYEAAMAYLTRDDYGNPAKIPLSYLDGFTELADRIKDPKKKTMLWYYLSGQYFQHGKNAKASELASRSLSTAAASSDPAIKVMAYLASARSARKDNRIKESWQNILNAENFITELPSSSKKTWKRAVEEEQIDFYSLIHDYEKALKVRQNQIEELQKSEKIDSVDYYWKEYYLCFILKSQDSNIPLSGRLKKILKFAKNNNELMLLEYTKAVARNYFIQTNQLGEFYETFAEDYKELQDSTKRAEFCYGNALFCEHLNKFEDAEAYYLEAIKEANKSTNAYRIANYYRQYGLFLYKNKMYDRSYEVLNQALDQANSVNYTPYILDMIDPLEEMARKKKDFEAAYTYQNIKQAATTSKANERIRENILIMELNNDKRQNEIYLEKKKEKEKKKYDLQYFAIAVGLIALFLLLIVLSSMRVPVWLVDMLGFFSILFIFEFVILILDHKIHHWAHGEPIKIFLVKIAILSVLFPLHHVVEHSVLAYMKKNQLLKRPKRGFFRRMLETLYPWMREGEAKDGH